VTAQGNIFFGDFFDKIRIRIEEHDVKVLDSMDALQILRIFEPYNLQAN
jgi:hypothetical protein